MTRTLASLIALALVAVPQLALAQPAVTASGASAQATALPPTAAPEPIPFGVDLLPYVGSSSGDDRARARHFSLNLVGGLSGGLRGAELGGVLNVDTGDVDGAQLGGVANVVTGDVDGAQVAGVLNTGTRVRGAQVSGVVNVAAGDLDGAQVGTVNVTAGRVRGVQIGLVNYATSATFQLGLVNLQREGRTYLEAWVDSNGFSSVGIKHGGAHFHYLYFVGANPFGGNGTAATAGLGLGGHLELSERFYLDLDALYTYVSAGDRWSYHDDATLATLRLVLGMRVSPDFAITVGASQNLFVSETTDGSEYSVFSPERIDDGLGTAVTTFPGLQLGLSYRL